MLGADPKDLEIFERWSDEVRPIAGWRVIWEGCFGKLVESRTCGTEWWEE
jgi:hypothetical protein